MATIFPRSHTLRPRKDAEPDSGHDLLGAESDLALLQELIEEEISAGYLEEMPDLESAYTRWGKDRVAVGKVNIVKAPGRSPQHLQHKPELLCPRTVQLAQLARHRGRFPTVRR